MRSFLMGSIDLSPTSKQKSNIAAHGKPPAVEDQVGILDSLTSSVDQADTGSPDNDPSRHPGTLRMELVSRFSREVSEYGSASFTIFHPAGSNKI
jgi:hypothetical protein